MSDPNPWYIAIGTVSTSTVIIMALFGYLYNLTQKRIDSKQDKSVCEPMIKSIEGIKDALEGPKGIHAKFSSMDTKLDIIVKEVKSGTGESK